MRFLGHIEMLDLKLHPKHEKPIWIAKFNFLGLLRVCESFSNFKHVRNLYEGGVIGEGVVKELRPLVAKGVHNKWATNLLLSYYRHLSIDLLMEATKETMDLQDWIPTCPLGDVVESSKYKRFSTLAKVSHRLNYGQPIPVLVFGCNKTWKIGCVVIFKKYWFFREIIFKTGDSIMDQNGITFHRIVLDSDDICLGHANCKVKNCLGDTELQFWDYGTLLPDLINDTVNYRYGILRTGWQYLDENHVWNEMD